MGKHVWVYALDLRSIIHVEITGGKIAAPREKVAKHTQNKATNTVIKVTSQNTTIPTVTGTLLIFAKQQIT